MTATLFVCVSCRRPLGDGEESFDQPGHGLAEAIKARLQGDEARLTVATVDCLAVCKRPCTVALVGADKWTYLIGDLDPCSHVDEIVAAAKSFGAADDGIVPWRGRAGAVRQGGDGA